MLDPWIAWYVQLVAGGCALILTVLYVYGQGKQAGMKFLQTIVFRLPDEKTAERHWYAVPRVGDTIRLVIDEEPSQHVVGEVKWNDDDEKVYVRLT
jgi:hypothetical protein